MHVESKRSTNISRTVRKIKVKLMKTIQSCLACVSATLSKKISSSQWWSRRCALDWLNESDWWKHCENGSMYRHSSVNSNVSMLTIMCQWYLGIEFECFQNEPSVDRVLTCDEKWMHYDESKRGTSWDEVFQSSCSSTKPGLHIK